MIIRFFTQVFTTKILTMKKVINFMYVIAFIVFAVSCSGGTPKANNQTDMQNDSMELYYTCTMHPEVHSDQPGNCPKCGMELVKREMPMTDSTTMHHHSDSMQMN